MVLLFNALITKHSFIAEKLETIFILPFFSPTDEITFIAGYLLTMHDENSHIWVVLECDDNCRPVLYHGTCFI